MVLLAVYPFAERFQNLLVGAILFVFFLLRDLIFHLLAESRPDILVLIVHVFDSFWGIEHLVVLRVVLRVVVELLALSRSILSAELRVRLGRAIAFDRLLL